MRGVDEAEPAATIRNSAAAVSAPNAGGTPARIDASDTARQGLRPRLCAEVGASPVEVIAAQVMIAALPEARCVGDIIEPSKHLQHNW